MDSTESHPRSGPIVENGDGQNLNVIFISYGRQDAQDFARRLAAWLRSQGYDPWLDVDKGIRIGDPFDIHIEVGIKNSKILIALLSPWSLRAESFCRNELLYAQTIKVPIIPVRIAEVIPPIQIISLNYIDAASDPERVFDELPSVIQEVSRSGRMSRRAWISPLGSPWWADRPRLSFEEELAYHGKSIEGREWLFQDLKRLVEDEKEKLILLTGDAGVGKSAFVAHATARFNICGVHFCSGSRPESCRAVTWIRELIYQLAAQFASYRAELQQRPAPLWSNPPKDLFRTYVKEPLRSVSDHQELQRSGLFIIDALDESMAVCGNELSDLIADSYRRLPPPLKLIVTARPHQDLLAKFGGFKRYHIDAQCTENLGDIHGYVNRRSVHLDLPREDRDRVERSLTNLAAGNFLYARLTLDALSDPDQEARLSLDELGLLPKGLAGWYHEFFSKRFKDLTRYETQIAPLLACLVAAQGPIPEALLMTASGAKASSTLIELSQFLVCLEGGFQLFHRSVGEWLVNRDASGVFSVSAREGHQRLARSCWSEFEGGSGMMSSYSRENLASHLVEADLWPELLELVMSPWFQQINRWIESGASRFGITCLTALVQNLPPGPEIGMIRAGLCTQIGKILSLCGEYDSAEHWLRSATSQTSWLKGRRPTAIAYHELASLNLYKRDFRRAQRLYALALVLSGFGLTKYHDEMSANFVGLATICQARYQYRRTIMLARRGLHHATIAGDARHRVAAMRLMGHACRSLGRYDDAESHYVAASAICVPLDLNVEKVRLMLQIGWLEYERAQIEGHSPVRSRHTFQAALESASKTQDFFCEVESQLSLGWCDLCERQTAEAVSRLATLKNVLASDWHIELTAGISTALAVATHQEGRLEEAYRIYEEVVELCDASNLPVWGSRALVGMGAIKWHGAEKQGAEKCWQLALHSSRRLSAAKAALTQINIDRCRSDHAATPQ
jgi:tetratricopeptide (TPR) repeat protein